MNYNFSMNTKVVSKNAPATGTGPFSHAIISGELIFTSGQIYLTKEGKLLEGTLEEQIEQILMNLKSILEEAGSGFEKVVKTTIYVTDMSNYGTVNDVYGKYFSEPFPAREVVGVKELPLGAKVEISLVASK